MIAVRSSRGSFYRYDVSYKVKIFSCRKEFRGKFTTKRLGLPSLYAHSRASIFDTRQLILSIHCPG